MNILVLCARNLAFTYTVHFMSSTVPNTSALMFFPKSAVLPTFDIFLKLVRRVGQLLSGCLHQRSFLKCMRDTFEVSINRQLNGEGVLKMLPSHHTSFKRPGDLLKKFFKMQEKFFLKV